MTNSENHNSKSSIEIGIIEIRRHIPVLYTFMKICKTNKTNVTIFITQELMSRLETYNIDKNNYDFVIKEKNESIRSFLKRVEIICNKKIDLLFVNTIHETVLDLLCYLSFKPCSKTVLVVHHANAWLKPNLVFDIKHIVRTIDTNLSSILISKFIFSKFDAIDVIYRPVRDHILKNMDYKKKIFTLPTSVFEKSEKIIEKIEDKKLKIVIPGLIQEHRKDYSHVFPVFENLFEKYNEKIKLYIPGMPVGDFGKQIYDKFNSMKQKGCNIEIYDHFVPDKLFDKILIESDIVLAPIRIKTRADGDIKEEYGKTVGSGVVYNAVLYAKPIIVPSEFNMLKELDSSAIKYENSKDLELKLDDLISNPEKLKEMKINALKNAQKFSLKNLQDYFEKNILTWLKGH